MSDPNQVFPPNSNFFIAPTDVGNREINMRQELLNTFFGTSQETAKSHNILVRRIRLDDSGLRIKCPCVDVITREADVDYFCPVCLGERYLWDEYLASAYFVNQFDYSGLPSEQIGLVHTHHGTFYLAYDINIKSWDKLADIVLDLEGKIVKPVKRETIWQIIDVFELRADNGKLEFLKLPVREEDVRYLNAPGK